MEQQTTTDVLTALKSLRKAKGVYLKVLELVANNPKGIAAREVEEITEKNPQVVNPVLRRMIKRQLLVRRLYNKNSRYKEFRYFLHPSVERSAIAAVIENKEVQQNSPDKFWLGSSNWVQPGARGRKYLKILLIVAQSKQVRTTEIVQKLGENPQAVNRRLQKMVGQQFLDRLRHGQEFYYSLNPAISKEAIKSAISAIAPELATDPTALARLDDSIIPPLTHQREIMQARLSKLPIFDPFWSADTQENWFKAIAQLTT